MEIRALTPAEQKYTYAQSMQLEGQTANIGHLRGDFDSSGYGFYTTWTPHIARAFSTSETLVIIGNIMPRLPYTEALKSALS